MKCAISITVFAFLVTVNYCVAFPKFMDVQVCPNNKEFKVCGDACPETCESYRLKQNISSSTLPSVSTPPPSGINIPIMNDTANTINNALNNATNGKGLFCKICKPGCACKGNMIEDKSSGLCVAPEQCPPM